MGTTMPLVEPSTKRTMAFIDGQNLFHSAGEAFGHDYPNYDIKALSTAITQVQGWNRSNICFYTGIPDAQDNPVWNRFWTGKLAVMGRQGIRIFSRPLRYRNKIVTLSDGTVQSAMVGEEKGIDVRIAIDIIRLAHRKEFDVALVFSQDQDLSEVAKEIRVIAQEQNRWIKIVSAFPYSLLSRNRRGIENTDWIRIDRALYDSCLDSRDYR